MQKFLDLFDSESSAEREYLKNILHKLYSKLVPRRKMIRKQIDQTLTNLIHEGHRHNGVGEMLDILGSIASGYAIPLREEHANFFKNIVIPLHKVQTSPKFFEQLMRLSMIFITKDRSLAPLLISGLLKYWPFAATEKEMLFLVELCETIEVAQPADIEFLIPKLFKRLVKCIAGDNLKVCDSAMCFFENDFFLSLVKMYKKQTYPIIVPTLVEITENHWQPMLVDSLKAIKSILKDIDHQAFEDALNMSHSQKQQKTFQIKQTDEERQVLDKKWDILNNKIKHS